VDEGVLQGWLLPVDEHMKFSYVRSKFVRAYEEGGVVLLDELDAADNNVLMIVHAALANGLWDIPLRGEGAPPLVRHDNFIVIAAANTHGHGADRVYVGRQQLDGATLDRFAMGRLEVDYDEEMERRAYRSVHAEIGQRLRARCRAQQGWTRDVSTRNIADAVKLSAQFSPEEAWFGYFADWKDGDLSKVGVVRDRKRMRVVVE
jgi:MoxR-like ATPase